MNRSSCAIVNIRLTRHCEEGARARPTTQSSVDAWIASACFAGFAMTETKNWLNEYSRAILVMTVLCIFSGSPTIVTAGSVQQPVTSAESEALSLHARARDGDSKAAEKAVLLFKDILKSDPNNVVATAYLGSSYALMGRHSDVLIDKVRYTNRGIRFLDQALEHGSNNFAVRVIRANVNLNLPEMFKRAKAAQADIEQLDRLYESQPSVERAKQLVPLYAALAKLQKGDSRWEEKSNKAANFVAGKR